MAVFKRVIDIKQLKLLSNTIRQDLINSLVSAGSGHSGGPLGMADVFTTLYFNILNHDEKPVLIDFSHAIDLRYPDSRSMLERDIRIVCTYFNKLGMKLDYMEEVQKVMK